MSLGSLGFSGVLGSDCQIRAIFRGTTCSLPQDTGIWQSPSSKTLEIPEEPVIMTVNISHPIEAAGLPVSSQ
jgi:hypothetical protein